MTVPYFCLIDTVFGPIGLAWSERGLLRLQLPDRDAARTRQLLTRDLDSIKSDPPDWLRPTIARLQQYFAGEKVDLSDVPLDLYGKPEFMQRLYQEMLKLRWGETVTYGGSEERTDGCLNGTMKLSVDDDTMKYDWASTYNGQDYSSSGELKRQSRRQR